MLPSPSFSCPPTHAFFRYTGRWLPTSHSTSWAGSTVAFAFTGPFLYLIPGSETERRDRWNGGLPTLTWTVDGNPRSADARAGEPLCLFEGGSVEEGEIRNVRVMLADWASTFQIESIVVASEFNLHLYNGPERTQPPLRLLFVGDSITSGLALEGLGSMPHGVYGAYPCVTQRAIGANRDVDAEIVAYPGITLVGSTPSIGIECGMEEKFWHASPWSFDPWSFENNEQPSIIFIALGTNDESSGVKGDDFFQSLSSFTLRLRELYRSTLEHIAVIAPFGEFSMNGREGIYEPFLQESIAMLIEQWRQPVEMAIEHIQEKTSSPKLHFIDTSNWLSNELTMDGTHPTVEGHIEIGNRLAMWMRENGLC